MQSSDESITPMVDVTLLCQPKQEPPTKTENLSGGTISPRDYHRYNPVQFPPQVLCFPRKVRFYAPHMRMRPYYVPHRTRTKSESSDPSNHTIVQDGPASVSVCSIASSSGTASLMETGETTAMMDISSISVCTAGAGNVAVRYKNPVVLLTKSRSLEDVRADNSVEGSQPSHEMDLSRTGCPVPTKHYTTLGCVPSKELAANECPRWFNCSALESRSSDKCYLYGQVYELQEPIPDAKVKSACLALCTCQKNSQGVAEFHCAHIDCPEFLIPHRAGYVQQYRVNDCCASRQACGQKRGHLAQCTQDGMQYYEGERIAFSDDPCLTCICSSNFNATDPSEQTTCYVNECAFELISPSVLSNGAAPVYYGKRCCPWEWRFPKQEDRVNRTNGAIYPMDPAEPMCKYGKLSLNVGEALLPEVAPMGVYECFCSIPPMVHCFLTTSENP